MLDFVASLLQILPHTEDAHALRDFLDALLSHVPAGIAVFDAGPDPRICLVTPQLCSIFGQPEEALLGKTLREMQGNFMVYAPDGQTAMEADDRPMAAVFASGESHTGVEGFMMRPDGARVPIRANAGPLTDANGNMLGGVIVVRDVTGRDRRRAEQRKTEDSLQALLDATVDAAFLIDPDGIILALNEAAAILCKRTREELLNQDLFTCLPTKVVRHRRAQMQRAIETREPVRFEDMREGSWVENSIFPVGNADGEVVRLVWFKRDITGRKQTELLIQRIAKEQAALAEIGQQALAGAELRSLFSTALFALSELLGAPACEVLTLDETGRTLMVAASDGWPAESVGLLSLPAALLPGDAAVQFVDIERISDARVQSLFADAGFTSHLLVVIRAGKQPCGLLGIHLRGGATFAASDQDFARNIANTLGLTIEQRQDEARLTYLSTHDALTGLYNRQFFDAELDRYTRGRDFPTTVVIGDLDGLKIVNDRFGHEAGDRMICHAATVLRRAFRGEDVVARIGGDEFAVLLPGMSVTLDDVQRRIDRAWQSVPAPANLPQFSISLGVEVALSGAELTDALRNADTLMYHAKFSRRREQ